MEALKKKQKTINPKEGKVREEKQIRRRQMESTTLDGRNKFKYVSNYNTCNGLNAQSKSQ